MRHSSDLSFYIIALGCSKNLVDAENLKGRLLSSSFNDAESSDEADIVIILTCGFITSAKEESIELIFDAIRQRDEKPPKDFAPRVVVASCLSERYFENIKDEIPEIDFLYGIVDDSFVERLSQAFEITLDSKPHEKQVPLSGFTPYRYIKIAEGCSNNCSYCAIPLIRGAAHSYPPEQILQRAREAAEEGAVEIILIAQDTAAYKYGSYSLVDIIDEIAKLPGVLWIRLLYCHPDHISDELIECAAKNKKVVRYFDIPFQHANSKILKSMGRAGSKDSYLALINKIRDKIPGVRLRSTFMVGYPGESDAEFGELLDFLKEARLDKVGAFIFSSEEGTRACEMPYDLSEDTVEKRYNMLMETQLAISEESLKNMIGEKVDVLVEEKLDDITYLGRSEFDAPEVDGVFYLTAKNNLLSRIVKAVVLDSTEYDLLGEYDENS